MRAQGALLRDLAPPADLDPHPGFYARVWDRIEAQRPVPIWSLFANSLPGRWLATAALGLVLISGTYLVSSERSELPLAGVGLAPEGFDAPVLAAAAGANRGAVFMNLVTYQNR